MVEVLNFREVTVLRGGRPIVDRLDWVRANLASYQRMLRPVLSRLEELDGPAAAVSGQNDAQAAELSEQIARKIENELQYPGQIRVVVIRETRSVEVAR